MINILNECVYFLSFLIAVSITILFIVLKNGKTRIHMIALFGSIAFGFFIGWIKNTFDIDIPDFIRGFPLFISMLWFSIYAWKRRINL